MRALPGLDRRWVVVLAVVAAVACAAFRLPLILRSGGLAGAGSTDDGVHFAAAAALLAGRAPYRDFLFLHPPGILLALAPFAALARVVGDPAAFAAARAVFIGLGAVNAALVVAVLRRFGPPAAIAGAVVYVTAWPVVFAERSALLEPLGCGLLLGALALLAGPTGRRTSVLAGALLGLAVVVKLTFLLPAVVVLAATGRRAPWPVAGAVGSATVVCLPFLLLAPHDMWREVVLDQLGRRRIVPSVGDRVAAILMPPVVQGLPQRVAVGALLVLMAVLVVVALRTAGARRFAVLFVGAMAMLLVTPSFYGHYAIVAVLPAALLVGVGVSRLAAVIHGRAAGAVGLSLAGALVLGICLGAWTPARVALLSTPPAAPQLVRAIRGLHGCITADAAITLIETGVLTHLLDHGCPVWPDVTGWEFDRDARSVDGVPLWPDRDPAWQAHALTYLTSGSAVILTRPKDGLSATTRAAVLAGPAVWQQGSEAVHLVEHPGP